MYVFENLNQTLIGMARELVEKGVARTVRGFNCIEIDHPVLIEITNPTDRYINITERKWNKYLPFAESLWIALGINDLDVLPAKYCKNLHKYSDNGKHWRAGYGPRIRAYTGLGTDICISDPKARNVFSGNVMVIDQLAYVVEALKRDINTRQAIIEIGDPVKDDFDAHRELKVTKDYPCSRSVQFMMVNGRLNCTLYIRSNDILYGMSAVNIFNFTWMQEYIANILGVPIGRYYHFANNLHMYDFQVDDVYSLAVKNPKEYASEFGVWQYQDPIINITDFDVLCNYLFTYEGHISRGETDDFLPMGNDMFNDWVKVFLHHRKLEDIPPFKNPYLNKLFNQNETKN